jgi:hypothetical protein
MSYWVFFRRCSLYRSLANMAMHLSRPRWFTAPSGCHAAYVVDTGHSLPRIAKSRQLCNESLFRLADIFALCVSALFGR